MADYYPLIARAVGGLDKNTGDNRRALYDRARAALVAQLRSATPPLEDETITRERVALEEAIRQVETEATRASREQPPESPAPEAVEDGRPASLRDEGLKNFREVMAEADDLGGAAAQANKSAREFYEKVPADQQQQHEAPAEERPRPTQPEQPAYTSAAEEMAQLAGEPVRQEQQRVQPEGAVSRRIGQSWAPPPPPPEEEQERYARPARSYRGLIRAIVLLLIVGGLAGTGYWQRKTISAYFGTYVSPYIASLRGQQPTPSTREPAPAGQPKITDRVGPSSSSPSPSKPATAPAASVAQKVVLYDEDPSDPQGKRYVGSAIWRTETVSPGTGLAPELAVRADVEIPERHMRMTWSLRRNTDKALPASHTIEIMFTLPADFSEGGIANIPGVLMKTSEQARGVPLAGLSVKVTNGYFLIGLSAVDIDVQRNIQFLKERDWFDIPIVYNSGKRAIMAMEKGPAGVRAFEEAFKAWGQ
ncbi:MAG TPA: hypothetical protein VHD14_06240 [Pseudolabrys sp.]|nr:hypothetical protein [Pseudolabrys sp.]